MSVGAEQDLANRLTSARTARFAHVDDVVPDVDEAIGDQTGNGGLARPVDAFECHVSGHVCSSSRSISSVSSPPETALR
jgi:hypothetical protein